MSAARAALAGLAVLAAAGCAARTSPAPGPPPAPPGAIERPIPYPVDLPLEFQRAVAAGTRTATGEPGPRYWQQRAEYALSARLLPAARRLEGHAGIVYHNRSPDALDRLHLNLIQNYHAAGAVRNEPAEVTGGVDLGRIALDGRALRPLADGAGGAAGWRVDGTVLTLMPPAPVPPGGTARIEIDYAFALPEVGAAGRMGTSGDDLIYLAYWYPVMAVYDDVVGWQIDPFLGTAEFYAGFGRYDVTIEAPSEWLVLGTGTLRNPEATLSEETRRRWQDAVRSDRIARVADAGDRATRAVPGTLRWRFAADSVHDVAYSATRASNWDATRTEAGDRDGDGRAEYAEIHALWRESAPRWAHAARYAQHSIAAHARSTATPYPWPHMTAVEGAGIIGGGMEYPMMTLIGDYNARGDSALYNVVAHELAHMWVPMIVSNDERRYGWMDEGTTTFNENLARTDFFPGSDPFGPDRDDYLALARAGGEGEILRRSDFHATGDAYGIASYQKPATALNALRALLGEEAFFHAYHEFFDRWAWRHPYPWDLFHTFENVTGRDLDWFWRAWYHETWLLDQAVGDVRVTGGTTAIVVEDRGRTPMPAPVRVTCAGGRVIDREVPVETWLAGRRRATLTVDCGAVRVEVDPLGRWPDADRANNAWAR